MTFPGDEVLGDATLRLPIEVGAVGEDLVVVTVHGDIDLSEAGELRAVLNDAASGTHRSVIVDMSGVRFIGSTGMGVLVELHHRLADVGRRLVVHEPSDKIRRAFEIAGVDFLIDS
jgi:anti-sigma B factor antagonist